MPHGSVKNRFPSASKSRSFGPLNNWLRYVMTNGVNFFRLRIVDHDAEMAGRQIELAVVPAGSLRFTREAEFRWRIAVETGHELALGCEIGNPASCRWRRTRNFRPCRTPRLRGTSLVACRGCRRRRKPGPRREVAEAGPRADSARARSRRGDSIAAAAPIRTAAKSPPQAHAIDLHSFPPGFAFFDRLRGRFARSHGKGWASAETAGPALSSPLPSRADQPRGLVLLRLQRR